MISLRQTKQRQIVLDAVTSRCDHPTAEQIYLDIHAKYPNISMSTVYRNLDILQKEKKILQVKTPYADRYDLTTRNHSHLICTECGKVVDVDINYVKSQDIQVSKDSGFVINGHHTLFEGICPECQARLLKENN